MSLPHGRGSDRSRDVGSALLTGRSFRSRERERALLLPVTALRQAFQFERLRSGSSECSAGVTGSPYLLPLAREFDLAVFDRAGKTKGRLVDLVAGLLARHHLKRDLIPVDCALEDRRAARVEVQLARQRRALLDELEREVLHLIAPPASRGGSYPDAGQVPGLAQ